MTVGGAVTVAVNDCVASVDAPLLAVIVNVKVPSVLGVPANEAVPSPLSVNVMPGGNVTELLNAGGVGKPPEVVTVKLAAVPTRKVA